MLVAVTNGLLLIGFAGHAYSVRIALYTNNDWDENGSSKKILAKRPKVRSRS